MNPEHEKKLWHIRFEKILELEEESFGFYQKLLKEKSELLKEAGLEPMIKQIMRDEGKHIRIAKDLLELMNIETPENGRGGPCPSPV